MITAEKAKKITDNRINDIKKELEMHGLERLYALIESESRKGFCELEIESYNHQEYLHNVMYKGNSTKQLTLDFLLASKKDLEEKGFEVTLELETRPELAFWCYRITW